VGVLVAYLAAPAILGLGHDQEQGALLPATVAGLWMVCGWELLVFAGVFGLATALARWDARALRLPWRHGIWLPLRALGWSLVLRLGLGIVLAVALVLGKLLSGGGPPDPAAFRPDVEAMVDVGALRDPAYLWTLLTMVSFGLAGLREELWRAGMLAGLAAWHPRWFGGSWGPWRGVVISSVFFGLAHTPQGPAGVVATMLLGLGLGAIMVGHRSFWDAVLAHGFFNATTFALLPWIADQHPELLGG
jgi:membrane protease YdiL (CAAX protease family)